MTQPSAAGVLPMSQSSFFADYETPLPPSGELTASAAELGVWLGIAERTARELAVKGVLVRTGSGRYALRPSVQNYVAYVRDQAEATGGTARLVVERAREARERADRLSLQNATARGELVRVADVTATWTATMRDVRARLLALPSRLVSRLPGLTPADGAVIEEEVRTALTEAAGDAP